MPRHASRPDGPMTAREAIALFAILNLLVGFSAYYWRLRIIVVGVCAALMTIGKGNG